MSVRERILTIRLMEKVNVNPALAEAFVAVEASANHERQGISKTEPDTYRQ